MRMILHVPTVRCLMQPPTLFTLMLLSAFDSNTPVLVGHEEKNLHVLLLCKNSTTVWTN